MHITFDVIPDDLLAFTAHHYEYSPAMRRSLRGMQIAGAAVILLSSLVLARTENSATHIVVGAVAAVVWIIGYPSYRRWSLMRYATRMFGEGSNNAVLGTHRLDLRDEGIACSSPNSESVVKWPAVERVVATDEYAFLYMGATQAMVIPRARVTEGNFDAFVEAVHHGYGARGV
jgi:hypothetical protein